MDASYSHMDRAFAELFFRGPANLDYFMPNDDDGSTGSDFQFPAYFSPEVEFGYPIIPGFNEHPSESG